MREIEVVHGRHWELTSYEWNRRTGLARFGYTHRFTQKHVEVRREQPFYVVAGEDGVGRSRFHMDSE